MADDVNLAEIIFDDNRGHCSHQHEESKLHGYWRILYFSILQHLNMST